MYRFLFGYYRFSIHFLVRFFQLKVQQQVDQFAPSRFIYIGNPAILF